MKPDQRIVGEANLGMDRSSRSTGAVFFLLVGVVLSSEQTLLEWRRRPWAAALLGLLGGPLGHFYAGSAKRGVLVYLAVVVLVPMVVVLTLRIPSAHFACYSLFLTAAVGWLLLPVDAFLVARRANQTNRPRSSYQRWWAYILIFGAIYGCSEVSIWVYRKFVAEGFALVTGSMQNTLFPHERFLVDKTFLPGQPDFQDVVCFRDPSAENTANVARVIGLPGDSIEIRDEVVFRNGIALEEPYVVLEGEKNSNATPELYDAEVQIVPEGHMYVMCDHRRNSYDSRMSGCLPIDAVFGIPKYVYWSMEPEQKKSGLLARIRWSRIGHPIR